MDASHDLLCAGASPKYWATSALASGEVMKFIHLYMQFGCAAFLAIIHVSDQPVAPSDGRYPVLGPGAATGTLASLSAKYWYCHVVPTTESPLVNELI